MENKLMIFENEAFGKVRSLNLNGEPWFVAADVCKALELGNPSMTVERLDDDEKCISTIDTLGGKQRMAIINEPGLYSLVITSRKPEAKAFKRWITHEVIPSIRKHGAYMTPETLEAAMLNPDYLLKVATALKEETDKRKALESKVQADAPKVLFADSVAASSSTVLVGELAKIMRQNGVDMGERRLFRWMRDNGYLIKRNGTDYNMPTQASMEQGLFRIKETVINHSDGHTSVSKTPKVTGKGQTVFLNKFLGEGKTV